MRIIAGKARGTNLYTLEGQNTRPTLDRVKESIFNIIQNDIQESIFIDVFAGSGAIGLEAASRNAKHVYMCEKSKEAANIVKKNIEKTHMQNEVTLYECDFENFIKTKIPVADIIYIDPPYKTDYAITVIKILLEKKLVTKDSIMIIETDREQEIIKQIDNIKEYQIYDIRKYGRASIIFVKLSEAYLGRE